MKENVLINMIKESIQNVLKEKHNLITESRADKLALRYLKSKGVNDYNEQMNIIGSLKHDIPNLRLDKGKYMLAALRMYYDEHSLNNEQSIRALDNALKYIHAGNHQNEYDENLNGKTLDELSNTFREISRQMSADDRQRSAQRQFNGNSQYKIIPINSYEEAEPYGEYTSWCVTHGKNAFESYTQGGNRFYFCLKNGFEYIPEQAGDNAPLDEYGLSMIAVNIDMNGDLTRITTRWNHDYNGENNSELETTEQLENIIGVRFYDVFKPYTRDELHQMGIIPFDEVPELLAQGKKPEEIFSNIDDFYDDFAKVKLNGKYNFINTNGEILSPNQWFDYADSFINGFGIIKLNGKYNYLKSNGEILSPNQWFDYTYDFHDGFATVELNGKYYPINTNGEIINRKTKQPIGRLNESQLVSLIKESILRNISEGDRHRPGYYEEYSKKRKAEGKPVDRHRPGYYEEYAKTHPEWAAKHPELLKVNNNIIGNTEKKLNKNKTRNKSYHKPTYFHYHTPSYWNDLDDMRDEDFGGWYPGDND